MKVLEIIASLQILIGTAVMLSSVIVGLKTRMFVPRRLSIKWQVSFVIAALFFSSYIVFFFLMLGEIRSPFEIISGSLFLASAFIMYAVFKLMETTQGHLEGTISLHKRAEDKLRVMELTDKFTGLYNRQGFYVLMDSHMKLAKRKKAKMFLYYADIANLKSINDVFGHQEGDLMIRETANILKSCFRSSDIIARIGGDEFAVFMVDAEEEYAGVADIRFQKDIEVRNSTRQPKYKLTVNSVMSQYDPGYNMSIDSMLDQAEELMYKKKHNRPRSQPVQ